MNKKVKIGQINFKKAATIGITVSSVVIVGSLIKTLHNKYKKCKAMQDASKSLNTANISCVECDRDYCIECNCSCCDGCESDDESDSEEPHDSACKKYAFHGINLTTVTNLLNEIAESGLFNRKK